MQEVVQYLRNLWETSREDFALVSSYMARDRAGIVHPDTAPQCNCTGSGPTKNGYWVCNSSGQCIWVPLG